jgi:CheY-like chemotaxis protein
MVKLNGNGPIVIVDDGPDARRIVAAVFEQSKIGNDLILLKSGFEFLEYLKLVLKGDREMPSLVLLDINMPGLDGFQTLEAMRAQAAFRQNPSVIVLTSSNDTEDERRAFEKGADGFQVKPFLIKDYIAFANSLESLPAPN